MLAGSAHAGDFFEPPTRMQRVVELPEHARLVETRAIAGLGQVWRYAVAGAPDTIVLAADGAWWLPPPVALGEFDEAEDFRTRLDVRAIDGRVTLAITVEARSPVCAGRDTDAPPTKCDELRPVAATLFCTRKLLLECEIVPAAG